MVWLRAIPEPLGDRKAVGAKGGGELVSEAEFRKNILGIIRKKVLKKAFDTCIILYGSSKLGINIYTHI